MTIDDARVWLQRHADNTPMPGAREAYRTILDELDGVRRGHWIKRGYACGEAEFECSHCHEIEWRANETDYCPNCGAKMEITNGN
jgi:hypothetical protein|nr:MAG TPA: zinc-ribbon containing domain protein [Caudoviricetes sp.]